MEKDAAREEEVTTSGGALRAALLFAALLGGNFALASGVLFVRLVDTGPVAAGFWRLFLALPFLFAFASLRGERVLAVPRATIAVVAVAGLCFAADVAAWHIGIGMTRLGNAVLFANSGSLVLMVWGFVVAGLWPHFREWSAIAMALTGAGLLMGRSLEISTNTFVGDLLSLMAGMFYAGYLIILHKARRNLGSWSLLFWSGAAGTPFLLALAFGMGETIWPQVWWPIVALFVVNQLIGQGLMVYSLGHFTPLVIGLALLTQPAIAATIGFFMFGEVLGWLDIAGMLLLGSALVVARMAQPRA
ncbi:MAG: DMT family transporter [Erythrobacter sp.]|nr:DMT family transporter [Erythrobacter sp.]